MALQIYRNVMAANNPEDVTDGLQAILTYMYAKPAWNRDRIQLNAALIPRRWFDGP